MDAPGMLNPRNIRLVYYFLLITAGAYFASNLFLFFTDIKLATYLPKLSEPPATAQPKLVQNAPAREYKALMERNLFAAKTDEARQSKEKDLLANLDKLALTSLNCTLVGTVFNEAGDSWAIIRDNQSNREEKVAVGSVYSGAKVILILRNKLVLNFNGKDELLVMGIEKIRADNLTKEQPGKGEVAGDSFKISKDFIAQSVNDLPKIMTTVRIRPFIKDGKPQGFKISNLKEGSMLKTMGFEDEDVIKGVNGQDIHSPEDVMRLYNALKDSKFFTISVLRNNQLKTMNYKVR